MIGQSLDPRYRAILSPTRSTGRGIGVRVFKDRKRAQRSAAARARILAGALLVLPVVANAQSGQRGLSDMQIAEKSAGVAGNAQSLEDVRTNLQQALNCLEGPQGSHYRRSAGDPCGGSGILQELPEGSINKIRAQKAIRLAEVGVTFHDFEPAHFTALAVRAVLAEAHR